MRACDMVDPQAVLLSKRLAVRSRSANLKA
jgi:hypothetical protein